MGPKSRHETVAAVFLAWLDRPTWRQSALASRVGRPSTSGDGPVLRNPDALAVSVRRVQYDTTARIVATCHRDGRIQWFRADRLKRACLTRSEPYREASAEAIDAFVRSMLGGFRGSGTTQTYRFRVRDAEGRGAARNLPATVQVAPKPGRFAVAIETAALDAWARHSVGLGDLVTAERPELRARIVELARGALRGQGAGPRKVNARTGRSKPTPLPSADPSERRHRLRICSWQT